MSGTDDLDEFVQNVNASQRYLTALILTLMPRREDAYDILQETNLVIWQKRQEFLRGTNFHAWASRIARNKVLAHRRKMRRDRLCFDDGLIGKLSADVADAPLFGEEWLKALWQCSEKLTDEDRALLEKRYVEGFQAAAHRRSDGTVARRHCSGSLPYPVGIDAVHRRGDFCGGKN